MNHKILTSLVAVVFCFSDYKRQQQLDNPDLKPEEIGFGPDNFFEPVNWNSLKSSDGGFLINKVIPLLGTKYGCPFRDVLSKFCPTIRS
ncbi:MAG: hypothetical protein R2764_10820 [Bacteroidales bacterium]